MITKFLGMQEDADEFRIAFQDDKGTAWYVRLERPVTGTSLINTFSALNLILKSPEAAVKAGVLRQEDVAEAEANRLFAQLKPGSKEWKM